VEAVSDLSDWTKLAQELHLTPKELDGVEEIQAGSDSARATREVVRRWIYKDEFATLNKLIKAKDNVEGRKIFFDNVVVLKERIIDCIIHDYLYLYLHRLQRKVSYNNNIRYNFLGVVTTGVI